MAICKRVHYWGTVQGVGFRITTQRIAGQHAVTGHVRNLPDGQVEVVVAGEADEIERFLAALSARMDSYIKGYKITDASEHPSGFTTFEIRI